MMRGVVAACVLFLCTVGSEGLHILCSGAAILREACVWTAGGGGGYTQCVEWGNDCACVVVVWTVTGGNRMGRKGR